MLRSRMLLATFALAVFALAGCASTTAPPGTAAPPDVVTAAAPSAAQRVVFDAKVAFNTALTAAVAYKRLPACSATAKAPCSDPAIVAQLAKAGNVADAALDAAAVAVRTPGFGASVQTSAAAAAQAAITAFVAITANLGVK